MTERELRILFAEAAIDYLGCNEADGSHKQIIDTYNKISPLPVGYKMKYSDAWCAAFVSAVASECKLTDIIFPECGCDRMISLYKKAGRWEEADSYKADVGDVIFYDWDDDGIGDNVGGSDHVGIVYSADGNRLTIVEGNMNDQVDTREIAAGAKFIRGYGLPDFASKADRKPEETLPPVVIEAAAETVTIDLPVLSYGAYGEIVKTMQTLLISRGHSCGRHGADKDFGNNTKSALLRFQTLKGLEADAVCGKQTWERLLKG